MIADFRNGEEQDSFEEQDLIGEDGDRVGLALMRREVIDWTGDRLSGFQQVREAIEYSVSGDDGL